VVLFLQWVGTVINRAFGYAGAASTLVWILAVSAPGLTNTLGPLLALLAVRIAPFAGALLFGFASFQAWREEKLGSDGRKDDGSVTLTDNPVITDEYADGRFRIAFVCQNPGSTEVEEATVMLVPIIDKHQQATATFPIGHLAPKQQHRYEHVIRPPSDVHSLRKFDVEGHTFRCEVHFSYQKVISGHAYRKVEIVDCAELSRKQLRILSRGKPTLAIDE
jgi:hypothetical protein